MRSHAKAVLTSALLVTVVLCLTASGAVAATGLVRSGEIMLSGPSGDLHHNHRIAVDHASGNVLKADPLRDEIVVYTPDGDGGLDEIAEFGTGVLSNPYGLAIEQGSGDVYVTDSGNSRIVRYATDAQPVPTYTRDLTYLSPAQGTGAGQIGGFKAAIAIDQASGKLLVADPGNERVKRFNPDGGYDNFSIDGSGSPAVFTGLQDLAVDSTGDVLVVDSVGGDPADGVMTRVERFSAAGAWEETIGPVAGAATVTVLPDDDSVIVSGRQNSVNVGGPPTLAHFSSNGDRHYDLPVPAETLSYSTVSGIASAPGPGIVLYAATDTSRGCCPLTYGAASIQSYAVVVVPDATAKPATQVTAIAATLHGEIDPNGVPGSYYFEYSADGENWSPTPEPAEPVNGNDPIPVQAEISGLADNTEYQFRLVGKRGGAMAASAPLTFKTVDADPPSATLGATSGITSSGASLTGTVNPRGYATSVRFELSGDGGNNYTPLAGPDGTAATDDPVGSGSADVPVSATASNLEPNREYLIRLVAANPIGVTLAAGSLTTEPEQALASDLGTRELTMTSARLKGLVNPRNADTTYRFEYGLTSAYGSSTPTAVAASTLELFGGSDPFDSATTPREVSAPISGLTLDTKYHFRLVVDNGNGAPVESVDGTFTTLPLPPIPITGAVSNLTPTSVTLNGSVDTVGRSGTARFSVGQTDGDYVTLTPTIQLAAASGPQQVSAQLDDLPAGGTFEVRIRATTDGGQLYGDTVTFQTPQHAPPAPPAQAGGGGQLGVSPNADGPGAGAPLGRLRLLGVAADGPTATLRAEVPGAGTLKVSGKRIVAATKRAAKAGKLTVTLRLTKAGRKLLNGSKSGRLTTTAEAIFTTADGERQSATRTIAFARK